MKIPSSARSAGLAFGVAILVAAGLLGIVGADRPSAAAAAQPGVDPAVAAPGEALGRAYAAVAAHVKPAVVSVYSEKMVSVREPDFALPFDEQFFRQFFGDNAPQARGAHPRENRVPQRGMGSGMILDHEGHILTNYHVVADVDEIKVQLPDKRSFPAVVVGADPKSDIAVIRIDATLPEGLPTVTLGNSDALEVGHLVIAIGAPFGLAQTVTHGIISAKGRSEVGITAFEDFLQTDAPINPGNSGGPLVNMAGEVIGMNSAIATGGGEQSAGVGFAIPSNMIKTMLPTLIRGGTITRGFLGVVIQDLNEDLARQFHRSDTQGALVAQVNKDSPAAAAGIQVGDIIVRIDGKDVPDTHTLRNLIAATPPGRSVQLDLVRDGKQHSVEVKVGSSPAATTAPQGKLSGKAQDRMSRLGLQLLNLTPNLARELHIDLDHGVVVAGVEPGSPADLAGLQAGDVLLEANRQRLADLAGLQAALDKSGDEVLLLVRRGDETFFATLRGNRP